MNKLYVVGIGPGAADQMTVKALRVLEGCDVIAGYGVYTELVKPLLKDKEYLVTPMRKEADRCHMAIDCALEGKTVAMISSGDAGDYGMSDLIYELAEGKEIEIEAVPGVTAALSSGAVLGAPLTHDFAVVSLSDLLTPWEKIEKRLECAAQADLSIAIYNPSSHRRADYLRRACEIVLRHLKDTQVDMFTTVFIGNRQTRVIAGKMITPRGYRDV